MMHRFLALLFLTACAASPPPPPSPARPPTSTSTSTLDGLLRDAWAKAGETPAARADDATFLRRAYVDIVGTVPPVDVTRRFLADRTPDKRQRLVDALLADPAYAVHWMNYWDDVLMGRDVRANAVDRIAFRRWLHARFAENAPWDRVVRDLVAATGENGDGGRKIRGPMFGPPPEADDDPSVNGAVNWTLKFEQTPQDLGGSAARTFLGVQIQCAQCHDHKTEAWKQDDFRRFSNAFFHVKAEPVDRGPKGNVRRVEVVDFPVAAPRFAKNPELSPIVHAKATALDGTDLDKGVGTRKALAAWMTSKQNPWFAKAYVNRMWGHFLGRGFYDPVDDMRASNPPVAPEILDRLAADFAAHGFDARWLVRTICATEAYQLAAGKGSDLWARFHLVPLGPEELLNAVVRVTGLEGTAEKAGVKDVAALRSALTKEYSFLFDVDEEDDEPDYEGTVSQALALSNGALVTQATRALPGSALQEILAGPGTDAEKLDALVLRVLARPATPAERERWLAAVHAPQPEASAEAGAPRAKGPLDRLGKKRGGGGAPAWEDLLWALLNSSEFTFNH